MLIKIFSKTYGLKKEQEKMSTPEAAQQQGLR